METVPFLGSVQMRVVQGSLQLLGSTVASGSAWHELHSPAGGLPIVLQTASAVSRPAVLVLRRIDRGAVARAAPPNTAASDAPRASTAEAAGAVEAVEAVEAVDAQAAEPMEEDGTNAKPSPLSVGAHPRTPLRPDLPQLVSAALTAATPGEVGGVAEETPHAPAATAAPAPAPTAVASAASVCAPPPPPLGVLSPLGPVWSGEAAHAPRTARALQLMTRYLQLRPLPALAELGIRGWLPHEWEAAADEIVESMWGGKGGDSGRGGKGGAEVPRLLLCGGRNVGKSSFARYLVNRALSAAPGGAPVCFLDTDVGQSELSPPGLVSLHVLGTRLLGPPHTHVRPAAVSCCVGDASPGTDPHHFLQCVGPAR